MRTNVKEWLSSEEAQYLIDNQFWTSFYNRLLEETVNEGGYDTIGEVTDLLISCGARFDGIRELPDGFMYGSTQTTFAIPESVETIGDNAFADSKLKEITLPEDVSYISDYCFADCKDLETVTILNYKITCGSAAFEGCNKIANIYYAGSREEFELIESQFEESEYDFHQIGETIEEGIGTAIVTKALQIGTKGLKKMVNPQPGSTRGYPYNTKSKKPSGRPTTTTAPKRED